MAVTQESYWKMFWDIIIFCKVYLSVPEDYLKSTVPDTDISDKATNNC